MPTTIEHCYRMNCLQGQANQMAAEKNSAAKDENLHQIASLIPGKVATRLMPSGYKRRAAEL